LPQRLGVLEAIALEKMREQHRHILAQVAQWRKLQVNDVEAVEQILTERPSRTSVRRSTFEAATIRTFHFDLSVPPRRNEFAFLNDAQELGLRFRTDGGDFSKKMVP